MQQVLPQGEGTLNGKINKELIWRRNAPYFYQTLYTQELEWPSLCVEWWVSESEGGSDSNDQYRLCHVFYGTHTSGEEKNTLVMAKVYLPNQQFIRKQLKDRVLKPTETIRKNDDSMPDKIIVQHQIQHDGEVHRIRHHPKRTNLIATRTPLGQIHIFNKIKFGTVSKSNKPIRVAPQFILSGHETEGYAMEWSKLKDGHILAGSYDGQLSLWDINAKEDSNNIKPLTYFSFHDKEIQQVTFSPFHDSIFASCDDEGQSVLWDTRTHSQPIYHNKGDSAPLYSIQFSPFDRHLFATAGGESVIKLWDVRNLSQSLFSMKEDGEVSQLMWSRQQKEHIWSTSQSSIGLWDISQQKKKFVHGGHLQRINQMDLHPFESMTVASVDNANDIHVFQPTPNIKI